MSITVYLYCTMAKPRLSLSNELNPKYILLNNLIKSDFQFNGSVCFKCECKEAFEITKYFEGNFRGYRKDLGYVYKNGGFHFDDEKKEIEKRTQLNGEQLLQYGKGKDLFALHLENVEAIEPMEISDFYKDEACTEPLAKAPQSWCYGYRKIFETVQLCHFDYDKEEFVNMKGDICHVSGDQERLYRIEKCMVLSIRSTWLCKIANGEKDLEVRKTCPKEIEKR